MNSIFEILDSLPYHEKTQILEVCAVRHSASSKLYQLLQELIENPHRKDTFYSQKFYGTGRTPAFSQLKKRVKCELSELICLLKTNGMVEEVAHRVHCTELLLQSQILLSRGLTVEGAKLLEKCLKTAVSSDLPDMILTIFDTARKFAIEGVICKKEIPQLEMIIKSHLQILVNQYCKNAPLPKERKSMLTPLLKQMNQEKSHWEILAGIQQALTVKDFQSAEKLLLESENILKSNQTSREIVEEFFLARQRILVQTGRFKEVIQECKKLESGKTLSKESHLELIEYQWYALFHQEKWDEALEIVKSNRQKGSDQLLPKLNYWEASIRFRQKHFKPALQLIHESQNELKSSPNYYLGSKMLEMMILFDQNDLDWLDYKVDNFRKLIGRWKGKINARIESAFVVFLFMLKKNRSDLPKQLAQSEHMSRLKSCSGEYCWNPIDFELIRYDQWIHSRIQAL